MAYDQNQDALRAGFITLLGGSSSIYSLPELWDKYLTSLGITGGTLVDRQKRAAVAAGVPVTLYAVNPFGAEVLGPEIAPSLTGGTWTPVIAGSSQDGSGLHFTATDPGVITHTLDTEDNVTYRIAWTQVFTSGSFRWQLYGDTTAHLGQTASYTSSGSFSEDVQTISAGSLNNLIRANANGGAAGSNTLSITALSIKKVL